MLTAGQFDFGFLGSFFQALQSHDVLEKGEPLGMIAQINCADLPENDLYPATGLLQFWINPNDEKCLCGR